MKKTLILIATAAFLFGGVSLWQPRPAYASGACETAADAEQQIDELNQDVVDLFNDLLEQEQNFIDLKLMDTSKQEIMARIDEFGDNFAKGLAEFWRDNNDGNDPEPKGLYEQLKLMTTQLHQAKIQQTMQLGALIDAELANEVALHQQQQQVAAQQAMTTSQQGCQLDTVGSQLGAASVKTRAIARGFTLDNQPRQFNSAPSGPAPSTPGLYRDQHNLAKAAAKGPEYEQKVLYDEYQQYFCDPAAGDAGCSTPGTLAGQNTDLPALLWGDKQSADLGDSTTGENNRRVRAAALRTLISPRSTAPIPPDVANSMTGKEELLRRRAHTARINAVYNVVAQMMADRVSVTNFAPDVSPADIRTASGVDPSESAVNPSYREIQEAMSRDRFIHPEYTAQLIGAPWEVAREEVGVNATRMQVMSDLYKRAEEMVFMEAAIYAEDLDKQMPGNGVEKTGVRQ